MADSHCHRNMGAASGRQKRYFGVRFGMARLPDKGFLIYSWIASDATHSGAGELEIYLAFNADSSAAESFRYGPNDGPWIPWCTLWLLQSQMDFAFG
jgi:hypothetical protein